MGSVALQPPRVPLKPVQSLVLRHSLNLQTSGLSSTDRKAKSSSQKGGKGSKGPGGPMDSKSSAGTVAKFGSGEGSKRTGKEAGAQTPRKADKNKGSLRRVLRLTKVRTLRLRQAEGLQFHSLRLSQTYRSTTGPANPQGTILYLLMLSALSGQVCLLFFRGTRHFPLIKFETELNIKWDSGKRNSLIMNARAWTHRERSELWFHPGLLTCLVSLLGPRPLNGTTGAVLGRI